jgi:serine/threonine protein kinase
MGSISKYLASGSYGCVIKPGYNCKKNTLNNDNNNISKIFTNIDDWNKEVEIANILKEIDTNNDFTVQLISYCQIQTLDYLKKNISDYNKCNIDNELIYQIEYEYGGVELTNIFQDVEILDVVFILKQFINIFEGLCKLDKKNIFHHDIKLNNILYNKVKNKFTLIDFGFYTTEKPKDDYMFIFFPSEYAFIKYKATKTILGEKKINVSIFKKFIKPLIESLRKDTNYNNIMDIYNNLDKNKEIAYISTNAIDMHKIDVYMLGITLYMFIIIIFKECNEQNNIANIPNGIYDLIGKMTNIDHSKRITIREATEIYKSLFP